MSGPFGSSQWMYSSASGFYPHSIDQSLRGNEADSPYLSRTPSSASNRKTYTISAWIKPSLEVATFSILGAGSSGSAYYIFGIEGDDLYFEETSSGGALRANRKLRDPSAFYHLVASVDTTQATDSNRLKLYVNGVRETSFSTENYMAEDFESAYINNTSVHYIGHSPAQGSHYLNGYIAEVNFIDGTALGPDSFGETKDGIWIPKEISGLTYGDNGFRLDFADNSAIGNDVSGKDNDFAVSAFAAADVTEDTPTNNHATWNPLSTKLGVILGEGNTTVNLDDNVSGTADMVSTMVCPLGVDIYAEFKGTALIGGATNSGYMIGLIEEDFIRADGSVTIRQISGGVFYQGNGYLYTDNVISSTQEATYTTNDIIGIKVNRTTNEVKFYKNNTLEWTQSINATKKYHFGVASFYTNSTRAVSYQGYFAASSWTYTPEASFLALCSASLPEPEIIDASQHFNTVLYTGNSGTQSITGVGFQPDWVWMKSRNNTYSHGLFDSVRGATKKLYADATNDERTESGLTSFDADGFTLGSAAGTNNSGKTYVSWNWLTGGSAVSNSDGSITSNVSANPEAGFSIVSWTGNNTDGATVGHGLSSAPEMVINKSRSATSISGWHVFHKDLTANYNALLDTNSAAWQPASTGWLGATTNSIFTLENGSSSGANVNPNGVDMITYCFHSVEGYSKVGMYFGNSSANGTYVHTGFKVSWLMAKDRDNTGSWYIWDDKRSPHNEMNDRLVADLTAIETADREVDFLSNGFKLRESNNAHNTSGREYIYLAFGSSPAKYSNAK